MQVDCYAECVGRRFVATSILAVSLLTAFVAAGQRTPAPDAREEHDAAPTRLYSVAVIGDSLSDPKSGGAKYLQVLRERCPESRFDTYARGGTMVSQMRKHVRQDLFGPSRPSYTHVLVFGGVNDIGSNLTAQRTVPKITGDLQAMYAEARRRGVSVVALTLAPWGGLRGFHNPQRQQMTLEINAWIRDGKKAGRVDHVVDAYALLSCGTPERLCDRYVAPFNDGLHFNEEGHRKLGEALHAQVFSDCR